MMKSRKKVVDFMEIMGKRYVNEFVLAREWKKTRLKKDWYQAFKFLISKLYYQGRGDTLSSQYLHSMIDCLDDYFLPNSTKKLNGLWRKHDIPKDREWTGFKINKSRLWKQFNKSMGKTRDREMVLDTLGYIYELEGHNVIKESISAIKTGRLREHRDDLRDIYGVGPKTSAFYLRDIVFFYGLNPSEDEATEIQPVDVWVERIIDLIRDESESDMDSAEWLVQFAGSAYKAALLNAGIWYFGRHTFAISLAALMDGKLNAKMFEDLDLDLNLDG